MPSFAVRFWLGRLYAAIVDNARDDARQDVG